MPPIYAAVQRFQQETSKPESVGRAALRALQFRASSSDAALYASDGSGSRRSAMDRTRIDRTCNFKLGQEYTCRTNSAKLPVRGAP